MSFRHISRSIGPLAALFFAAMMVLGAILVVVPQHAAATEVGQDEPWLDGYGYRKSHVINPSTDAGAGYIVGIKVINGTGTDGTITVNGTVWGKVYTTPYYADFRDVRFTDDDKFTQLGYWIENKTDGLWANFWVRVADSLSSAPATIYVYYHNAQAVPGSSGESVFPLWDDFADRFDTVWHRYSSTVGVFSPSTYPSSNTAEPNVLYEANSQLLSVPATEKVFKMWYRHGYSSWTVMNLGYAESLDGISWTEGTDTVFGFAIACPSVAKISSTYYLSLKDSTNHIDIYSSTNGVSWTIFKNDALAAGAYPAWDSDNFGNTFLWKEGSTWYLLYEAKSLAMSVWNTGLATSSDGLTWTKYGSNPVLGNNGFEFSGPFLYQADNGTYYCWGHSGNASTKPTDFYRFHSADLHTWVMDGTSNTYTRKYAFEGAGLSDSQVGDCSMVEANGNTYFFYGANTGQDFSDFQYIGLAIYGNSMDNLVRTYEEELYDPDMIWASDTTYLTATGNGYGVYAATDDTNRLLESITDFNANVQVRYDAQLSYGASNGATLNYRSVGATPEIDLMISAINHKYQSYVDGSHSDTGTTNVDTSRHLYDVYWSPSLVQWNMNGTGMVNATVTTAANIPSVDLPVAMTARTVGGQVELWNVWARPFVNPEPEHSTWGAREEAYSGGEPEPEPDGEWDPAFTSVAKTKVTVGHSYSYQAACNESVTFELTTSAQWLSMTSSGLLVGTPSKAGTSTVSLKATNSVGGTSWQNYSIVASNPSSVNPNPGGGDAAEPSWFSQHWALLAIAASVAVLMLAIVFASSGGKRKKGGK